MNFVILEDSDSIRLNCQVWEFNNCLMLKQGSDLISLDKKQINLLVAYIYNHFDAIGDDESAENTNNS